jgi:PTS system nitrogen regulatory IIA component
MEDTLSTIAQYIWPEDIILDIEVDCKDRLFDEIGRHMEREHAMPRAWVATALSRRERVGSTGLGEGVAIPHARVEDLSRVQAAYLRLKTPIPFEAHDGQPVSDVLVLLVPKQATEEHLRILADATQIFSDRRFREQLHSCRHPVEVKSLFDSYRPFMHRRETIHCPQTRK